MIGAFLTGLLGSLHCLGMCGPLAMALPGKPGESQGSFLGGRLAYNSGRIFTYSLLGGIVSFVGMAAAMFEVQQYVSLLLGTILIFMALRSMVRHSKKVRKRSALDRWVFNRFSFFMQRPIPGRLFILGALNGLLPCGLVYIGLFQAALTSNIPTGMLTMAVFGLGTLPMMLGVSLSGNWLRRQLQGKARLILPSLMLVLGIMLGIRGMALGIPYLSPSLNTEADGTVSLECHSSLKGAHSSSDSIAFCK